MAQVRLPGIRVALAQFSALCAIAAGRPRPGEARPAAGAAVDCLRPDTQIARRRPALAVSAVGIQAYRATITKWCRSAPAARPYLRLAHVGFRKAVLRRVFGGRAPPVAVAVIRATFRNSIRWWRRSDHRDDQAHQQADWVRLCWLCGGRGRDVHWRAAPVGQRPAAHRRWPCWRVGLWVRRAIGGVGQRQVQVGGQAVAMPTFSAAQPAVSEALPARRCQLRARSSA